MLASEGLSEWERISVWTIFYPGASEVSARRPWLLGTPPLHKPGLARILVSRFSLHDWLPRHRTRFLSSVWPASNKNPVSLIEQELACLSRFILVIFHPQTRTLLSTQSPILPVELSPISHPHGQTPLQWFPHHCDGPPEYSPP